MNFFTFKKLGRAVVLSAALALGAASGVSALDLSLGFGAGFNTGFGAEYYGYKGTTQVTNGYRLFDAEMEEKVALTGGSIIVFFDATYAEVNLGVNLGVGQQKGYVTVTSGGVSASAMPSPDAKVAALSVNIGVLGKYPVALNDNLSVFPLAGIDYLSVIVDNVEWPGVGIEDGDFSALWIKFGAGLDVALSQSWFFRPEILYGIRMKNKFEGEIEDKMPNGKFEPISGSGLNIKLGFGIKI